MLRAAIVGLPNVGKSTLFNALTRTRKGRVATYPFCTIERNVGMVTVPDSVPGEFELIDLAGLVKGASKGEGLGNKFLADVRDADVILHVVRGFEDKDVIHVSDTLEPIADIETITSELFLADLGPLTKKPTLFVCNVSEDDLGRADELPFVKKVRDRALRQGSETFAISARIEAELGGLPEAGVKEHFATRGLGEPRAGTLARAAYRLAGGARAPDAR